MHLLATLYSLRIVPMEAIQKIWSVGHLFKLQSSLHCTNVSRSFMASSKKLLSATESPTKPLVLIEDDPTNERFKIMKMNRPPVNSLNLEMFQALISAIDTLESLEHIDGAIVHTTSPSVFCAGLDLSELHNPNETRLREFWSTFQQFYIRMYGCKVCTAAAITGHSPAGGTLVAMCCDYRAMHAGDKKYTIGLNETTFGLSAPGWLAGLMVSTIGQRKAERALLPGTLFSAKEAFDIGLVDDVTSSADETLEMCRNYLKSLSKSYTSARAMSKGLIRKPAIESLKKQFSEDVDLYVKLIMSDNFQKAADAHVKAVMAAAAAKKKKKS